MKNQKRILLVIEDNELNREMLCAMLEDDYQLYEAENGQIGLELMRAHAHELSVVLLDIQMPVMNGYEVLEAASQDPTLCNIPIIVTTSSEKPDEEERCLKLGAADFIQKPYNPNITQCRISNIINLQERTATLTEVEIDPVTGIYTRSAFTHYANMLLRNHPDTDFSIIMTDILGFQRLVEIHGEKAFQYLRKEAEVLSADARPLTIYARYSYDQFILLLPTSLLEPDKPNLVERLDQHCCILSEKVNATIKFGVCMHIERDTDLKSYINRTRKALSSIKHQYNKNVGLVNQELLARMKRNEEIELAMEDAIKEHQLEIYLQPKHHTASGKLAGAEVLLRWFHPVLGNITTGEYIPIFNETGFISEADAFAWREACKFLKTLQDQGLPQIPISVNTTRIDYESPTFEQRLLDPVNEYNINPKLLHIEVTEQIFAELSKESLNVLQRCRNMGMRVELDDFGTGYSSLHSLAEIPTDMVKFDRSFIIKLDDRRQMNVMSGCVNLVKRLNLTSVAEGVETEECRKQIASLGIDFIQGYYYAKPMPISDFIEYIRQHDVMTLQDLLIMEEDPHLAEMERMRRLAEEEPLTGLNNRYSFYNNVNMRIEEHEPFTLVIFDIDKFKNINDTYGHLVGDKVLTRLAEAMHEEFKQNTLIRLGGDEFAIIFNGVVGYQQMLSQMQSFFAHIEQLNIDGLSADYHIAISAGCVA
ncbi:MAG: EAL domain-containing protein, partial [Bacteroidales bacterium]|nr:EAL domain-containing protein [Bacteroidales bacterium]